MGEARGEAIGEAIGQGKAESYVGILCAVVVVCLVLDVDVVARALLLGGWFMILTTPEWLPLAPARVRKPQRFVRIVALIFIVSLFLLA